MLSSNIQKIIAVIATVLLLIFILGLSHSISTGFAGFWGGLPFMIIAIFVLGLALYNMWEEGFKSKD